MKFLIYAACIIVMAIIQVTLETSFHIRLGAIPMVLLYAGMTGLASFLCRKWDEHKQ